MPINTSGLLGFNSSELLSSHFIAGLRRPRVDRVAARRVPHGLLQRRQPRALDAQLPGGEDDGQDQGR